MDHLATTMDFEVTIARLETQIDAALARLETKIAETHTTMWRIAVMLLVGQAVLPPVVERLLEKL